MEILCCLCGFCAGCFVPHLSVILRLCAPSEKALKVLRRTQCHSALILAETQPLQGELEDALARAYATMGESVCRREVSDCSSASQQGNFKCESYQCLVNTQKTKCYTVVTLLKSGSFIYCY